MTMRTASALAIFMASFLPVWADVLAEEPEFAPIIIEPIIEEYVYSVPECSLPPPTYASDVEALVWQDICDSGTSDLRNHDLGTCASDDPDTDGLYLSARFLATILTDPAFVRARPTQALTLICAHIDHLDLQEKPIPGSLRIQDSVIDSIDLTNARIDGELNFNESHVRWGMVAAGLTVARNLTAESARFENGLVLRDATISGYLSFWNATVTDRLNARRIRVTQGIFMNDGTFDRVDLYSADIGGNLEASQSKFKGEFNANAIRTAGSVFLDEEGAVFQDVYLRGAQIGGDLATVAGVFNGKFDAGAVKVRGSVFLRGKATFNQVHLLNAEIGGNLEADGSTFTGVFDAFSAEV